MTKQKKFITCLVVYVTMLAVAITVGFFIAKSNLDNSFTEPPTAQEGQVLLIYKTEGDMPTETTVTFDLAAGTVNVKFLASSMYQGEYTVPFKVESNQLSIDTAGQIEAIDISGVSGLIGLPSTWVQDVTHHVTVDDGRLLLKIIYGEDVILFDMAIEGENLSDLGIDSSGLTAVAATGVTLDQNEMVLEIGTTGKLVATIQPEGAIGDFAWTSSDDSIASVDADGNVTAVAAGSATITVTAGNGAFSASCPVTVTEKEAPVVPAGDVVLEFVGEGDAPTVTTVTFHLTDGTVDVVSSASGAYDLVYQTTFTIADGVLDIADVSDLTAVMKEDMIPIYNGVLGLPVELPGNAIHQVTDGNLTILFGDPANTAEAANLGSFALDMEVFGGEAQTPENVWVYDTGGDTPTVTTLTFDEGSGTVTVEALASGAYVIRYTAAYSYTDGVLQIADVSDLIAVMTEEAIPVFNGILGLPVELPGTAIHTVENGVLTIRFGDLEKLEEAAVLGEFRLDGSGETAQ